MRIVTYGFSLIFYVLHMHRKIVSVWTSNFWKTLVYFETKTLVLNVSELKSVENSAQSRQGDSKDEPVPQ